MSSLVKYTRFELDGIFTAVNDGRYYVGIVLSQVAAVRSISSLPSTNRYLLYIIID